MNEQTKKKIIELKSNGKSYSYISNLLNINVSTIKTVVSRSKSIQKNNQCLFCGKRLIQTKGHRQKKFCCSGCKDKYWNLVRKQNKDGVENEQ
ncbi:MAG: helix-turn-helix domain containing protein [Erysipelotrichaceae bacterium]|nr:helix-turn-helix domain containing protein [Erysipelotrichaceae bacterium]